jgi:NAD(P)H-dependent FMN reductase
MSRKIQVALVLGSIRAGRLCDAVAKWTADRITSREIFALEVVDPAAPELAQAHNDDAARRALRDRIGRADAVVIVTPEYNHGYPGALKLLIDSVNAEWQAKPIAFVCYGGISGGLRAVEQLRLVFAELHAVGVRDSVSFANAWDQFDADGQLRAPAAADLAISTMLSRLAWWASALRAARETSVYASAA